MIWALVALVVAVVVAMFAAYALIQASDDEPANPLRRGFDTCLVSKFGIHNFIGMNRRCSFCGRELEDCIENEKAPASLTRRG